ncbi:MAG: response regulator [Flammeovirgaceae bacterium]|nr:MAG: response regulator [Flammeovirgaceae bacterium]
MVNVTLLIDDSDIDLFIQRRFLEVYHFSRTLISYKSADDALSWLGSLTNGFPDVIFLDLNMPKTDGFAFLEKFSGLPETMTAKSKIIILTSSNSKADVERAMVNKNVVHFITKPIKQSDIEELKAKFTSL